MLRNVSLRLALIALGLGLLLPATFAYARPPKMGETVQGTVTLVDLKSDPKHVTIRQDDGGVVDIRIGPHTQVILEQEAKGSGLSPQLESLRNGLIIRSQFQGAHYAQTIEIVKVPPPEKPGKRRSELGNSRGYDRDALATGSEHRETADIRRD